MISMKVVTENLKPVSDGLAKPTGRWTKVSGMVRELSNFCVLLTVILCLVFSIFTVPRLFGISPFVVQSASMEPTIPTGSVVFVNTKDTEVEEGDIVTYSLSLGDDKAVFVTHRVSRIDTDSGLIQTKGDNNDSADGWLEPSAITGTVVKYVPWCGFVLDSLQRTGFVMIALWMAVINLILMMIPYILTMVDELEETP